MKNTLLIAVCLIILIFSLVPAQARTTVTIADEPENILSVRLFADHSAGKGDWWVYGIDSWTPTQDIMIIGFLLRVGYEETPALDGVVFACAQWGTNIDEPERSAGRYGGVSSIYYPSKNQTLGDLSMMFPPNTGVLINAGQPVYLHLASRGFQSTGTVRVSCNLTLYYVLR